MKYWVKPYLKELMPNPVLRLSYEKSIVIPEPEAKYWGDLPCDGLKENIYTNISIVSHLLDPNSGKVRKKGYDTLFVHYDFADPQTVDAGLHLYEHTPDFLRWLLDRMIEEDFREGIVLVEKRLAEIGATDEDIKKRFEL